MDETLYLVAGWLSLFAAAGLGYVVLTERIQEGVVIKAGLICMVLGLLATAALTLRGMDSWRGLFHAGIALRGGLCLVIAGYWLKRHKVKHPCMRLDDWRPPGRAIGADEAHMVMGRGRGKT